MDGTRNRGKTDELRQFISFAVGDEEYGLELLRVKEVIRLREITWLPKAPVFVKGIINLRGDVIPIISLREKFGLPETESTAATRVIVVEADGRLIGMVVDSASQVVRIPTDQIEPPPPMLGGSMQDLITAVGKLDDKLIILLDVDAVLTADQAEALGELEGASRTADAPAALAAAVPA